jgi:LPS-assembly protein
MMPRRFLVRLLPLLLLVLLCAPARAQLGSLLQSTTNTPPASRNEPVTFAADQVEYDRENALVIARGHVEAWQNDHVLRADEVVFNRNTGTAAAKGNVVLLEPDGEVLFADYAEMTKNMQEAVLKDMRGLLAENGKLAANGARRTAGLLNELSRVVYSACNLCKDDPQAPPLWQIRASSGIQDLEHKRIEYEDAVLQMYGVPVAYFPFLSMPDPSVKRSSGLLMPGFGTTSQLGAFVDIPYYWVIDDQSDATFTPMLTTRAGPQLETQYRRRFNNGYLSLDATTGYLEGKPQGTITARGEFTQNDTWRWGFEVNRASSLNYLRDLRFGDALHGWSDVLASQFYGEGFGEGAYSRIEARLYQGVSSTVVAARLPVVLPRYQYSYFGRPDDWGGRLSVDTDAFNVMRSDGTDTRRARLSANWDRPFTGALGDLWNVTLHTDVVGYDASDLNQFPNFATHGRADQARAQPTGAVMFRWPFMRDSGSWGVQVIEPILQLVVSPQVGDSQWTRYPNEDSLDIEFTDANLFSLNRFPGVDRMEGGVRLNAALHGTWYLGGTTLEALIGQSYRTTTDKSFPAFSGLRDSVSDVVARMSFAPTNWLSMTTRGRFDHRSGQVRMAEAVANAGVSKFAVNAGYTYTSYNPYVLYSDPSNLPNPPPAGSPFYSPRDEITLGVSSRWDHYRFSANARRDLTAGKMVAISADAAYEDECFIFDLLFYRRYTSVNSDSGATAVLLQFTFKTIGQFGYRAL